MKGLRYHLRYWLHRFSNEFRQLTLQRLREQDVVGEVMNGLKRDPLLREVIEEKEAEMRAQNRDEL